MSLRRIHTQLTASTSNFEQRDFVIRELIDTETNYYEVLNALRFKFMQPMEKLLSKIEIKSIFPKIKELTEIHEKFLEKLKDAISTQPKFKLSHVFLEFREPFLIYGEYCSNMTNATDTLRDVTKRSAMFEQLIQVCVALQVYLCKDGTTMGFFFFLCSNARKSTVADEYNCEIFYRCQCNVY